MLPINQKFELRIVKELATTASGECRERILISRETVREVQISFTLKWNPFISCCCTTKSVCEEIGKSLLTNGGRLVLVRLHNALYAC